jgi:hypothetical protein
MQPGMPTAQKDEAISVRPSQSSGYDYLIAIRGTGELPFDPDDQAARDQAALAALKNQCDSPQIVGETVIKSDGYLRNDAIRGYEIKVRC